MAGTSHLESDLISRSAQKFTMASNSLKEMQDAIVIAHQNDQRQHSPLRSCSKKRAYTPRNCSIQELEEEETPEQRQYLATEDESLKTSLRKELGIDGSDDGSPHRFFDWENQEKDDGPANPNNFSTIEQ